MDFLYGVNFCLALQMGLLVYLRKRTARHKADWLLLAYMFCAAGLFLFLWVNYRIAGLPVPVSLFAGGAGFLLLLGLFLAYVIVLVKRNGALLYLAFLPFAVLFTWQIIDASVSPQKYGSIYGITTLTVATDWGLWQGPVILFATITFPFIGLRLIAGYRRELKDQRSMIDGIDLDWIRRVWWAIGLSVFVAAIVVSPLLGTVEIPLKVSLAILFIFVSIQHFYVGWHGLAQIQVVNEPAISKSARPRLSASELSESMSALSRHMEEHRPYLKGELTLVELADQLGWSRYRLSAVLNEGVEKSFFDFINAYRVAEVKRQLREPKYRTVTLLSVALDAGFNSKTTFNTVFKKFEGMSPSQFRKSQLTR